ncbi:MAG: hypothetical protein JNN06_06130, partial [Gemmobacter sp.]|uniref:hypothetical protein n=1 Tax=Gemmobacter sp. TaxID=1898957 RepID=UPI001A4A2C40
MRMQAMAVMAAMGILAGCALPVSVPDSGPEYAPDVPPAEAPAPLAEAALAAPPPAAGARTAEALDTTTEAQRAAATAAPAPAGQAALGKASVSLGDPTAPGFWLKTVLVSAPAPGLVKLASGQTVQVELQPGSGTAQLSLAAYRALGLSLTDLPEVEVF